LNTGEIKFPHNLPWSYALELLKLLKFHGYRAYLVGGCVRDILWGLEPGDYDIATSARPQQMFPFLPEVDKIGLRYGVLRVKKGEFHYQIATFRQDDAQSDGRRPKRIFFSDLEGDAKRRDFTINAIYLDPLVPALIDPQNGIPDLETKILRIIGDPAIRLREDHL
jgi:poly(A) polymerase